jgi:Ankyrin repeats (many copies)
LWGAGSTLAYESPSAEQQERLSLFLNALNEEGGAEEATAYLDAGGDINAAIMPFVENTLLQHAAINRRLDLIEMLASRGADMNVRDFMGMTPLHSAVLHEIDAVLLQWQEADFPCARKLFRLGASTDVVDNNGRTPGDYAGPQGTPMRAAFDEALMDPHD